MSKSRFLDWYRDINVSCPQGNGLRAVIEKMGHKSFDKSARKWDIFFIYSCLIQFKMFSSSEIPTQQSRL